MSFAKPELILTEKNPKDCSKCKTHVKNARAISWDYGFCPRCYELNITQNTNPLETVVKCAVVNPMDLYLNRYTPFEMEEMRKK